MSSPSSAKIGVTVSLSAMMFVPGGGDGLWVKSAEVAMSLVRYYGFRNSIPKG